MEQKDCEVPIDWLEGGSRNPEIPQEQQGLLLKNVHSGLPAPLPDPMKCSVIRGDYLYFHYGCDGQDDRGWGCGYRTVQTLSSWLRMNGFPPHGPAPSLTHIQQALVSMQDKPDSFLGSRGWIGTFEASLVLDFLHDVPCRVVHVRGGSAELEHMCVGELHEHFRVHGSPVMMGGDRDNSSKGIVGVCTAAGGSYLLVVDPHYYGVPPDRAKLQARGWVAWRKVSSLNQDSFYNLCLPQTSKRNK